MTKLVYMDNEDIDLWKNVSNLSVKATLDSSLARELKQTTENFWGHMLDKYGVLRNKQLNIDEVNWVVSSWTSQIELIKQQTF